MTQIFLTGKPGKLVFVSGPSGAGKSTVAGMIAKKHEWIHYEGDGFLFGFNPYVFPNESQVDARSDKPALIGEGMAARFLALKAGFENQIQLALNLTTDRSPTNNVLTLMANDILKERQRIGGDWIVSFAIAKRVDRDFLRKVLGKDLIFVVLDISLGLVIERLSGREGVEKNREEAEKFHSVFEPAEKDEPNTIPFEMKRGATREENAQAIFDLINKKSN